MLVRVTRTKGRRLPAALGVVAAVVLATTVAGAAVQASPAQAQPAGQTVVSFAWGGGFRNQLGALPVFRRYGMHATFFVPSGLVCQPAADPGCMQLPYLTLGNIRQIAANGNEIGGLSVEHVPFNGLPAAEIQRKHGAIPNRVNTPYGRGVVDPDTTKKGLQVEFMVEDPAVFTMPWSGRITYRRLIGDWPEAVCAENPHFLGTDAAIPTAHTSDF